jgi:hypothetical protein
MADNALLKEFRSKDVKRLRNLFSGNATQSTGTQVGYEKGFTEYKEGDTWVEDGKEWTIKDGIRQTNTKYSSVKKALFAPLVCPSCKNSMKHRLDSKFYSLFEHCFSCQLSLETKLRAEGKYEEYAQRIMTENAITFTKDARAFMKELNGMDRGIYTETGEKQNWTGNNSNDHIIQQMDKELTELENRINETN